MSVFGRFQTIAELASNGPFTVFSAHRTGENPTKPTAAVKTFRTVADDLTDPEMLAARAASFLRAAKALEQLSAAAPKSFIKVHETGETDAAAFYVADLAALSGQWLTDNRQDLSPRDLVRIIRGVVDGLIAIRASKVTTAHGNLKLSNILLTSRELDKADAILTDPLDPKSLSGTAPQDDMRALGSLMFELVTHRTAPSGTEIRKGPEWQRLGGPGEPLRHLCEQLLNPTRGQELSPDDVKTRLEAALRFKGKKGSSAKVFAAAAVVLLGVGGIGAYMYLHRTPVPPPVPPTEPTVVDLRTPQFRTDTQATLDKFFNSVMTGAAAERFTSLGDPGIALQQELRNRHFDLDAKVTAYIDLPGFSNNEKTAANEEKPQIDEQLAALAGLIDDRLDPLEAGKSIVAFETKAADIKKLIDGFAAPIAKKNAAEKQAAIDAATPIKADFETATGKVNDVRKQLETPAGGEGTGATEKAGVKKQRLRPIVDAAIGSLDDIKTRARTWEGTFNQEVMEEKRRIEKEHDDAKLKYDNSKNEFDRLMWKFLEWAKEDAVFEVDFAARPFIARKSTIQKWIDDAKALDALTLKAQPAPLFEPQAIPALAAAQRRREVDAIIETKARPRTKAGDLSGVDPAKNEADWGLVPIEKRLAQWMTASDALLNEATELQRVLDHGYGFAEARPSGKTMVALRDGVKNHPRFAELAKAASPGGETPKWELETADKYKAVADAITGALTRVDAVDAISKMAVPKALRDIIAEEAQKVGQAAPDKRPNLSRMIAAWNRLLALNFPANPSEFDDLKVTRALLPKAIATVSDKARQDALTAAITESFRTAWFALVNQRLSGAPADIEKAFSAENIASLDLTEEKLNERLRPVAKFNLRRLRLLEELSANAPANANDKQDLARRVNKFFEDVAKIPGFDPPAPEFKELERKFDRIRRGLGDADLKEEGPAKAGWAAAPAGEDGARVVYTKTAGSSTRALEFVKLNGIGGEDSSHYLCTTEVSLGLFLDILDVQKEKPVKEKPVQPIGDLLFSQFKGNDGADRRDGPRTWSWDNNNVIATSPDQAARKNLSKGWIRSVPGVERLPAFYQNPRAMSVPTYDHPMNHVSLCAAIYAASLANCRLPTPEEWQAATLAGAQQDANRRDNQWSDHFEKIERDFAPDAPAQIEPGNQPPFRPTAGIFLKDADAAAGLRDRTKAVEGDDTFLWFAKVAEKGESVTPNGTFHHLIGNVAEFVCTNTAFAAVGKTPDELHAQVVSSKDAFKIVGASALSPAAYAPGELLTNDNITNKKLGFSDVGFRLAFTTAGGSGGAGGPYAAAIRKLRDLDYIPASGKR